MTTFSPEAVPISPAATRATRQIHGAIWGPRLALCRPPRLRQVCGRIEKASHLESAEGFEGLLLEGGETGIPIRRTLWASYPIIGVVSDDCREDHDSKPSADAPNTLQGPGNRPFTRVHQFGGKAGSFGEKPSNSNAGDYSLEHTVDVDGSKIESREGNCGEYSHYQEQTRDETIT